jgi:hypothetical protein
MSSSEQQPLHPNEPYSATERIEEIGSEIGLAGALTLRAAEVGAFILIGLLVCPPLFILVRASGAIPGADAGDRRERPTPELGGACVQAERRSAAVVGGGDPSSVRVAWIGAVRPSPLLFTNAPGGAVSDRGPPGACWLSKAIATDWTDRYALARARTRGHVCG